MLQFFTSIFLICMCATLTGNEGNLNPVTKDIPRIVSTVGTNGEIAQLDDLIAATQHSLEQLTSLRELVITFQDTQKAYLKSSEDVEMLIKMIKIAKRAQDIIAENHLTYAFDAEFLNELKLFAQMANKRGIPKS